MDCEQARRIAAGKEKGKSNEENSGIINNSYDFGRKCGDDGVGCIASYYM